MPLPRTYLKTAPADLHRHLEGDGGQRNVLTSCSQNSNFWNTCSSSEVRQNHRNTKPLPETTDRRFTAVAEVKGSEKPCFAMEIASTTPSSARSLSTTKGTVQAGGTLAPQCRPGLRGSARWRNTDVAVSAWRLDNKLVLELVRTRQNARGTRGRTWCDLPRKGGPSREVVDEGGRKVERLAGTVERERSRSRGSHQDGLLVDVVDIFGVDGPKSRLNKMGTR